MAASCSSTDKHTDIHTYTDIGADTRADIRTSRDKDKGRYPHAGWTQERYIQELQHIEQLVDVLFELGDVRRCVPTLVENGLIGTFLQVLNVPLVGRIPLESSHDVYNPEIILAKSYIVRHMPHTVTDSLRLCVDSSISQFMDLLACKKFARETLKALDGVEIHIHRLEFEAEQLRMRHVVNKSLLEKEKVFFLEKDEDKDKNIKIDIKLGLSVSEQSFLVSLLTIIDGSVADDQNTYLWNWVSTQAFSDTMVHILQAGCVYSSALLTSVLRLLETLVREYVNMLIFRGSVWRLEGKCSVLLLSYSVSRCTGKP